MSQPVEVMAFRKRALKRGYANIRIFRVFSSDGAFCDRYLVRAVEPLAGIPVSGEFYTYELCSKFRY